MTYSKQPDINLNLVAYQKRFIKIMLRELEMHGLETAIALEEIAGEIRIRKAAAGASTAH